MSLDDDAFLAHLLATFRVEADEHLQAMAALVRELEPAAAGERAPQLVEALFREAHSLKGAARAVNLSALEADCAALERTLAAAKRGELALSPALLATLGRSIEALARQLADGKTAAPAARAVPGVPAPPPPAPPPAEAGETVRIATAKLSALLVQSEELLAFKFGAGHLAAELAAVGGEITAWQKAARRRARAARTLRRGATEAAPETSTLLAAGEQDELFVKTLGERLARLQRLAEHERRALAGIADKLQEDMKQALMQPFASLLELLPKLVRDLARDSGKEALLDIDGAAIEIDRRILEQMKDPLIHLMRNAIDHGLEPPAERARRGKPAAGRIRVAVAPREGNKVELLVEDDGGGMDLDQLKAAGQRLGLVTAEEAARLGRREALELAFASGLSTSPILTDISGRGLGLAIVREKVEKLGGELGIELPETGGTRFRIVLPTTLANFRGLLVTAGGREFVLPARNVERVARVATDAVRTVENREAIEIEGRVVALVRLADVLGLPAAAPGAPHLPVVVLAAAGKRIAFAIDAVLGDQEVLVKNLGPQLQRVRNVAGATVLGAGRLVPILSVPDLLKSALAAGRQPAAASPPPAARRSLLVVEDSITSRALLKNILESAGYAVATAIDGIDALTALRSGAFDLVVSDVEMPRLDGFGLTARIREDKKLAELPVVLVTALESRQDKERGIDVGANAYIVKSSFDQSNLLEVIGRLL